MMTPREFERLVDKIVGNSGFCKSRRHAEHIVAQAFYKSMPVKLGVQFYCDCGNPLEEETDDSCMKCFELELILEEEDLRFKDSTIAQIRSHSREDC